MLIDYLVGHNIKTKRGMGRRRRRRRNDSPERAVQDSFPGNYFLVFFNWRSDPSVSGGGNVRVMI